jgi:xanthine dehydrogenase large subunit
MAAKDVQPDMTSTDVTRRDAMYPSTQDTAQQEAREHVKVPSVNTRKHESAAAHVSGQAVYTDDQRLPTGMLSAAPVMSPHAHARMLGIKLADALEHPGVITILQASDVPGINDTNPHARDEVLLPVDEVCFVGQPVVWVIAETETAATEAAKLVKVDYEPLPARLTMDDAITKGAFHGDPMVMSQGDVAAALASSDTVLTGDVRMNGQDHFYLETQAAWVIPNTEGYYQVYSSTQHPTETQTVVADVLGIPFSRVVVTCLRMGGGFGGKETQANPAAAVAALASLKTKRPVRVRLKRHWDMHMTGKRHGFLGRYQVGFDSTGKVHALDLKLYSDGGWSSDLSLPVLQRAMFHSDNAYTIPNMHVEGRVCNTNKASNTAFRGFGGPQGMIVIEDIISRVAQHLGKPADDVRARNFYSDGDLTHYGQTITETRLPRVWQELKENASYDARLREIEAFNAGHPHSKRGLAITPVKFGISFTNTPLNQAGALVLIYTDGSIQVNHGGTEMGQGLHTKMLEVARRALGVSANRFRVMPTSTDKVPNTSATAASSGSDLNGQAVLQACETIKERLLAVTANMLGVPAESIDCVDDMFIVKDNPDTHASFDDVVKRAYLEQVSLSATGYYRTPNVYFNKLKGKGKPFHYYAYGAAVSEVEVDGFTGCFKLRQVDIVHDVGTSLNAHIDRGQIEGGFVQGMGWLTMEELVWNDDGKLLTHAPSTYKIPTIGEVPETFHVKLLERAPQDGVIYGSKAVGEPPFMLAMSVREAIRAAVAAFASSPPKHVPLASPATPEATLMTIEKLSRTVSNDELVVGD